MSHRTLPGRRLSAVLASITLVVTSFVATSSASATEVTQVTTDVAEPTADPATVSADALPTVQVDGIVWKQVIVGNTVYVGGEFANARPAGAAPGTNLVRRTNLLAYNLTTGELITSFNHTLNGNVTDLAASPDGTRLYVVGGFTTVNGAARSRIAAFNLPSGSLNTSFAPNLNGTTKAVAATNTTVYAGGHFSAVNNTTRYRVAAMNASNGALQRGFVPVVDNRQVQSIVVSPDEQSVAISGTFTSVNSDTANSYGIAWLDSATGATRRLPVNATVRNAGDSSSVMRLTSTDDAWYGVGWHYNARGTTEGTFKVSWDDGTLVWIEDCHGDTYDVAAIGDVVYTASHKHYCGNSGGFPETSPRSYYHSTAFTDEVRGTNTKDIYNYPDHPGTPRPDLLTWYPRTSLGTYSGKNQATWTVTGNEDYVLYGGEFPRVNGVGQQGLVRYAKRSAAPNESGPVESGAALNPTVASVSAGTVRINLSTTWDRDDEALTYRIYRDSLSTEPVFKETIAAKFWKPVQRTARDTGLAPGSEHRYRLTVTDPSGNVKRSEWIYATVSTALRSEFADTVVQDGAAHLWRLGEPGGSNRTYDWAGADDLVVPTSVQLGAAGAITGDSNTAATFRNSSSSRLVSTEGGAGPNTFSIETWVRSDGGGRIVGFGNSNSATGTSSSTDRLLYVDSGGRLTFGVNNGSRMTLRSPGRVDDGDWHHVVATLGSGGMQLFVDGARVADRADVTTGLSVNGYWRIGADTLSGWPSRPVLGDRLTGSVDDVAIYPTVLSAAKVSDHYVVATTGGRPNHAPVADAAANVHGFDLTADGSGSADPDGTIEAWAWSFGDGTTGTGQEAAHTYAAPGTYTVTLTVTDDEGATAEDSVQVEASVPTEFATDDFSRSVTGGWGAAAAGGPWTLYSGSSNYSVADGEGAMTLSAPGANRKAHLREVSAADVDLTSVLSLDEISDGGGTFVSLVGRADGFSSEYRAKVWVMATGAVQLQLVGLQSAETTLAATNIAGLSVAPGERLAVRMRITGSAPTTLEGKVWKAGTTEPADWQLTTTDSTPELQDAGGVGYSLSLSGRATTGENTVRLDNLWAGPSTQ
ncbi:FOG: PKD repeat [Promicromonospora umidemergens]|uniref:PKD domain-containing protein n=1 Tax=Promicromonospora umidemergens TaxID=629679 RepID=A0ABP8Y608_9MICO|nr:PKD domain-containing protein [Promicromonospora umidemergens]MCP2282571.1 FOG: PKD repeat [Promicromonospora umidemergens]